MKTGLWVLMALIVCNVGVVLGADKKEKNRGETKEGHSRSKKSKRRKEQKDSTEANNDLLDSDWSCGCGIPEPDSELNIFESEGEADNTEGNGYVKSSSVSTNFEQTVVDGKVVSKGDINSSVLDGTMTKKKNKKPVYKGNVKKAHAVFGGDMRE